MRFELIEVGQGNEKMLKGVDAGIQADPKTAMGYLDLGARSSIGPTTPKVASSTSTSTPTWWSMTAAAARPHDRPIQK
jgi:hypothetical protein